MLNASGERSPERHLLSSSFNQNYSLIAQRLSLHWKYVEHKSVVNVLKGKTTTTTTYLQPHFIKNRPRWPIRSRKAVFFSSYLHGPPVTDSSSADNPFTSNILWTTDLLINLHLFTPCWRDKIWRQTKTSDLCAPRPKSIFFCRLKWLKCALHLTFLFLFSGLIFEHKHYQTAGNNRKSRSAVISLFCPLIHKHSNTRLQLTCFCVPEIAAVGKPLSAFLWELF